MLKKGIYMLYARKVAVLVIMVMSLFLPAYGASILKVAMLHYGPIGDYGWTYEGHIGVQEMAAALPYVELAEREEASGSDAPQIIREYAEGTSYLCVAVDMKRSLLMWARITDVHMGLDSWQAWSPWR
jgi:basic membrane lipoprotein Med (substrate-binding protein (PBP1-ABC) superfamily)